MTPCLRHAWLYGSLALLVACGGGDKQDSDGGSGGSSSGGHDNAKGGKVASGGALGDAGDSAAGQAQGGGSEQPNSGGSAGSNLEPEGGANTSGGVNTSGGGSTSVGGTSTGGTATVESGGSNNHGGMTGVGGTHEEGSGGEAGSDGGPIQLSVHADVNAHAISPLIYGINPHFAACSDARARPTLCRAGGDPFSTYNWENNASNEGVLACAENNAALGSGDDPATYVTALVSEAREHDATTFVTLPMLDYVAADKAGGSPAPECSGDVRLSADYVHTRFKRNQPRKGTALQETPDTTDDSVSQDEFLHFLKAHSDDASVVLALDNQPELWSPVYTPFHPDPVTYAEIVARSTDYAQMIRANWPGAEISGYGGYGYKAFRDLQDAPDAATNGLFLDYYLSQMQAASSTAGERLIDYLDVHWYSEAQGDGQRVIVGASTPGLQQARVQAPRSLWDASYSEDSWIAQNFGPIQLLPWLRDKVDANYPGTKLAISEWSYGGEGDISGAIAIADALGIYGREGVGLAALSLGQADADFALAGFAAFRNYDGAGAHFGDTSVQASSSDIGNVSLYASTDSAVPERIVTIAINRSTSVQPVTLELAGSGTFSTADIFTLTSASATLVPGAALSATTANHFALDLPAYSVTVLVAQP